MPASIAITGGTGRIGGKVAGLLAARGVPHRLIVRDISRAPSLPGVEVATASYQDGAAMRAALSGITTLFLVSATESPDRPAQHESAVDAAVAAGVRRIVYLSFFGAAPEATFTLARDHWLTERCIASAGMGFTFLQDNLYADFLPGMVGDDGIIRGPAGDGRFAPVAQRDVAAAAATVLLDPAGTHDGRSYRLTGPDLLSMHDVAETISASTGRTVRFQDETEAEAYTSREHYAAPDWEVQAWVSTYQAIAAGELAPATDDVSALTGRSATSLADLLRG